MQASIPLFSSEHSMKAVAVCLPVTHSSEDHVCMCEGATVYSSRAAYIICNQSLDVICRCAGIFSGHAAVELYAEVFEAAGALDQVSMSLLTCRCCSSCMIGTHITHAVITIDGSVAACSQGRLPFLLPILSGVPHSI